MLKNNNETIRKSHIIASVMSESLILN